jgi:hypothetical protein
VVDGDARSRLLSEALALSSEALIRLDKADAAILSAHLDLVIELLRRELDGDSLAREDHN